MQDTAILWLNLASIIGGALGALALKQPAWKGGLAVMIGAAASIGMGYAWPTASTPAMLVANLVVIALAAGAFGLKGSAVALVAAGSFAGPFLVPMVTGNPFA